MLFIVLAIAAIVIGLIVGIVLSFDSYADGIEWFFGLLMGIFAAIFLFGIMLTISVFVPHHFTTEKKNLFVLQDGTQTGGSFFLGIGTIDGTPTYTYYVQEGKGAKLANTEADEVIVYQDTDKAYLVQQTDCKTNIEWLIKCATDERVTEIHVPKNTIKQNFVLDAK